MTSHFARPTVLTSTPCAAPSSAAPCWLLFAPLIDDVGWFRCAAVRSARSTHGSRVASDPRNPTDWWGVDPPRDPSGGLRPLIWLILNLRPPACASRKQLSSRSDNHSVSLPGVSTGYREISPALLRPRRPPVIDDKLNISGTVQPV